eukprot:TRINITY_DN2081_c0_g3_i1.p1 TRINITY_DN2081_c0_g3~~TRINITY_DN2081_c0_g3_i1.p1  ORF type:complete len:493 (+),score=47.36 TRINITY_DN2081_c0_g3_i1:96-1481(+)
MKEQEYDVVNTRLMKYFVRSIGTKRGVRAADIADTFVNTCVKGPGCSEEPFCNVCDVEPSPKAFLRHVQKGAHIRRLARIRLVLACMAEALALPMYCMPSSVLEQRCAEASRASKDQGAPQYFCVMCEARLTDERQYIMHADGAAHKRTILTVTQLVAESRRQALLARKPVPGPKVPSTACDIPEGAGHDPLEDIPRNARIMLLGEGDFGMTQTLIARGFDGSRIIATDVKRHWALSEGVEMRLRECGVTLDFSTDAAQLPGQKWEHMEGGVDYVMAWFMHTETPNSDRSCKHEHQDLFYSLLEGATPLLAPGGKVMIALRNRRAYKRFRVDDMETSTLSCVSKKLFSTRQFEYYRPKATRELHHVRLLPYANMITFAARSPEVPPRWVDFVGGIPQDSRNASNYTGKLRRRRRKHPVPRVRGRARLSRRNVTETLKDVGSRIQTTSAKHITALCRLLEDH